MDGENTLSDSVRQIVEAVHELQTSRRLATMNAAHAESFKSGADDPNDDDPEFTRWQLSEATQNFVMFGQAATDKRQDIVELVDRLSENLGDRTPRTLLEFSVLLHPHGDESKALEKWPNVQLDLRTLLAAKPSATPETSLVVVDADATTNLDAESRALAVLALHPNLASLQEVAHLAGCTRQYLSKKGQCLKFKAAWKVAKEANLRKSKVRRGSKSKTGEIEAFDSVDNKEFG